MGLGSFLKKVNKVANKVQKFNSKLSRVDRALKTLGRAAGTTKNKSKVPLKRPGA